MSEDKIQEEMHKMIQDISVFIQSSSEIKKLDFAIFYKNGQLSFLNLEHLQKELEKQKEQN